MRPTPDPMLGAETLLEAHELITGDRQAAYSHPFEDYSKVVDIFEALTGVRLTLEQALLFMVSVKMARLRTNLEAGTLHRDSLVDAMGYLGCLAMTKNRLEENKAEAEGALARAFEESFDRYAEERFTGKNAG